jgi:uncharacterized protein
MMNTRNILIVGVLAVITLAVVYTLTGTDDPEVYIEKIEKERDRQFKFIKLQYRITFVRGTEEGF